MISSLASGCSRSATPSTLSADRVVLPYAAVDAAQRVAGRHISDRENAGTFRNPQLRCHPNETLLIEHFGRQPAGIGSHPPDRPQHRVADRWRLPRAPADRSSGDLVAVETGGNYRAVPGMQYDTEIGQPALDAVPDPRVVGRQCARAGNTFYRRVEASAAGLIEVSPRSGEAVVLACG
jgi:hypothetical protein